MNVVDVIVDFASADAVALDGATRLEMSSVAAKGTWRAAASSVDSIVVGGLFDTDDGEEDEKSD